MSVCPQGEVTYPGMGGGYLCTYVQGGSYLRCPGTYLGWGVPTLPGGTYLRKGVPTLKGGRGAPTLDRSCHGWYASCSFPQEDFLVSCIITKALSKCGRRNQPFVSVSESQGSVNSYSQLNIGNIIT